MTIEAYSEVEKKDLREAESHRDDYDRFGSAWIQQFRVVGARYPREIAKGVKTPQVKGVLVLLDQLTGNLGVIPLGPDLEEAKKLYGFDPDSVPRVSNQNLPSLVGVEIARQIEAIRLNSEPVTRWRDPSQGKRFEKDPRGNIIRVVRVNEM